MMTAYTIELPPFEQLPFLLRCSISLASFSVTPAGATTRSSLFVIACVRK